MPVMHFYIEVDKTMGKVFQLIVDLAHYKDWLPESSMYSETTSISDNPVRPGTTYIDKGKTFTMTGEVTEIHPPAHISFRQEEQLKLLFFSSLLVVQIQYTLVNIDRRTRITRATTLTSRGVAFAILGSRIAKRVNHENERILAAMKTYLESH